MLDAAQQDQLPWTGQGRVERRRFLDRNRVVVLDDDEEHGARGQPVRRIDGAKRQQGLRRVDAELPFRELARSGALVSASFLSGWIDQQNIGRVDEAGDPGDAPLCPITLDRREQLTPFPGAADGAHPAGAIPDREHADQRLHRRIVGCGLGGDGRAVFLAEERDPLAVDIRPLPQIGHRRADVGDLLPRPQLGAIAFALAPAPVFEREQGYPAGGEAGREGRGAVISASHPAGAQHDSGRRAAVAVWTVRAVCRQVKSSREPQAVAVEAHWLGALRRHSEVLSRD